MSEKTSVVAVLPDGAEHFEDIRPFGGRRDVGMTLRDYETVAENAVRKKGLTTPRSNPVPVKVSVFKLEIKGGKLDRNKVKDFPITPPLERMTDAEYNSEMAELLAELPEEFRSYVSSESYDHGHSAGYEECVSIARSMVHGLKPVIDAYTKRIKRQ